MQSSGSFTAAGLDLRQIILANADCHGQFALNHVTPFANDAHRIVAFCEAIRHGLRQRDFTAFLERAGGTAYDPARGGIFLCLGGWTELFAVLVFAIVPSQL